VTSKRIHIKQMHEVRKSIQDLEDKFSNMDEKLSKGIEILKRKSNGNIRNEKLNKSNLKNTVKASSID
jgi:hypothetical protein